MSRVRAISLFSGGLDSICATRLVMEQGIEVIAVKFVSPFFGYDILRDPQRYKKETLRKYGIDVTVVDISADYLRMLRNPAHGFGRYFNPCIDCKIFMLEQARAMLEELDAGRTPIRGVDHIPRVGVAGNLRVAFAHDREATTARRTEASCSS